MIGLIQLVTHADVKISGNITGAISRGIVALIGIEKTDTEKHAEKLFEKIVNYRIFPDAAGKMNLSLRDIQGGLLLVSQFTLAAETHKGTRPGFSTGMPPDKGKLIFEHLIQYAKSNYAHIAAGE